MLCWSKYSFAFYVVLCSFRLELSHVVVGMIGFVLRFSLEICYRLGEQMLKKLVS